MASYSELLETYEGSKPQTKTFRVLVYGKPGSGKTTFAASFPEPLFIDCDKGMLVLRKDFQRIPIQRSDTPFTLIRSILEDAKAHKGEFAPGGKLAGIKTIVIDSLTWLVEFLIAEAMVEFKRNPMKDKATFDEYGCLKSRMNYITSLLKDLSEEYNIVGTAWVNEEKDEVTGAFIGRPALVGSIRDRIGGDFDEEYYMETKKDSETKKDAYWAYASSYRFYEAKTRLLKVTSLKDATYKLIQENLK